MTTGITIIIILLVPIFFQVIMQEFRAKKRHADIMDRLRKIEEELNRAGEN